MTPETTHVANLGTRLVQSECNAPVDALVLETATSQVMRKLQASLTQTLGFSGVGALALRSLRMAQRIHPQLAPVSMNGAAADLSGLGDVLQAYAGDDALALSAAIPQQFINLLVNLIGADLALIPIGNIWPALRLNAVSTVHTEKDV